jgi:streptogramin lyase
VIASGPDENLWFTGAGGDFSLGRFTLPSLSGEILQAFNHLPTGAPQDVAAGPDGNLWVAAGPRRESNVPEVWRLTPEAQITQFEASGFTSIESIAAGPEGNMWFTGSQPGGAIGRITPGGEITAFNRGLNPGSVPVDIAQGADGSMWFTDEGRTPAIGRITPAGAVEEFSAGLAPESRPRAITPGPDGNVWFTDEGATNAIGRITPGGSIAEFPAGGGRYPEFEHILRDPDIAAGPDGSVWFMADYLARIGRITPSGKVTEFEVGAVYHARGITPGADGNIWFTADTIGFSSIGRLGTGAPPALQFPPVIKGPVAVGGQEMCSPAAWASWAGVAPSPSFYAFYGSATRASRTCAGARPARDVEPTTRSVCQWERALSSRSARQRR